MYDIRMIMRDVKCITQDDVRDCAISIIDIILEDVLDRYDITLPCKKYEESERENCKVKSRVWGELYFEIEDRIKAMIEDHLLPINDDEYNCEVRKI